MIRSLILSRRRMGLGLVAALAAPPASARTGPAIPDGLTAGPEVSVRSVLSGDSVELRRHGTLLLAGVQAPRPALGAEAAWPFAAEATRALTATIGDRPARIHYAADRRDRWGRILGHLVREDGLWIQGVLLMRGWVRVRIFAGIEAGARAMLDLERTARAGRAGIWGHRYYRIRNPAETWGDFDSYQLVEGRVTDGATVDGTGYLNFGTDWRRDFTFRIGRSHRRAFRDAGLVPEALRGRRVRGRGWVFPRNGPMIDLTHPVQLEVLEE